MKFTLKTYREGAGSHIDIAADHDVPIVSVDISLDGHRLALDRLPIPSRYYERSFVQAGVGGPGNEHVLIVEVTDSQGASHAATRFWQDNA